MTALDDAKAAAREYLRRAIADGIPVAGEVLPRDPLRIGIHGHSPDRLQARIYYRGRAPYFIKMSQASRPVHLPRGLEELDIGRLTELMREIYDVASVPFKLTGKFAHITDLSAQALDMLGDPVDPVPGQEDDQEQEAG